MRWGWLGRQRKIDGPPLGLEPLAPGSPQDDSRGPHLPPAGALKDGMSSLAVRKDAGRRQLVTASRGEGMGP
jgi:hypothetical protein